MTTTKLDLEITAAPVRAGRPSNWARDAHWRLEAFDRRCDGSFPLGTLWATDFRKVCDVVFVDFILVADHERRKGVATALVAEARRRFGRIRLTDPISDSGRGFLGYPTPQEISP